MKNRKIIGVDFDGTLAVTRGTYPKIQRTYSRDYRLYIRRTS